MTELKRQGYRLQRTASHGAAITLVSRCNEYAAMFECATKCAQVLGERAMEDLGDGILEVIPYYRIPTEELYAALQKLSQRFSIALVEYAFTRQGGQFVTLWRIERQSNILWEATPGEAQEAEKYTEQAAGPSERFISKQPSTNLDDY